MINEKHKSPNQTVSLQIYISENQINQIADAVIERLQLIDVVTTHHKEILTPTQVEELLDISHSTRIEWTRQGTLRSYSYGGRKLYYKYSEIISGMVKINH